MERLKRKLIYEPPDSEPAERPGPVEVPSLPPAPSPNAEVIHGASVQTLPVAGMTVAQARDALIPILNLDRRAPALIDGVPARENDVIAPDSVLEFVHFAGEKGHGLEA